jgi:hypothetical protein
VADSKTPCDSEPTFIPYEKRLDSDFEWAFIDASRHFHEESYTFRTFRKLVARLRQLGIPYAALGDLAMFRHGYRRYTEVVELLVTRDDLELIHDRLIGDGYAQDRPNSKSLRDVEFGVKILFSLTGEFPGDSKPKPVAFQHPKAVTVDFDGVSIVRLETLIELKLAAGISNLSMRRDTADVQDLIRELRLPVEFAQNLHPQGRCEFHTLWSPINDSEFSDPSDD